MAASSRMAISVETSGPPRKLPPQMENNLLRIAQEALANALKHAHASRIAVHLDYEPGKVSLRVTDDGVGFDPTQPSGHLRRPFRTAGHERTGGENGRRITP